SRHTCNSHLPLADAKPISAPSLTKEDTGNGDWDDDDTDYHAPDRHARRMARGSTRAAPGGEGAYAPQRRVGTEAARATVGSDRQGISLRHRRRERLAGRSLPRPLTASRVSLHVRARLRRGLPILLEYRRRL